MTAVQLEFIFETMVQICSILTQRNGVVIKTNELAELKREFVNSYNWDSDSSDD